MSSVVRLGVSRASFRPVRPGAFAAILTSTRSLVAEQKGGRPSVFMRNAGNQPYITGANNAPPFPAYVGRPGEPRHWGTQLSVQY
jgi:hypothetical protein